MAQADTGGQVAAPSRGFAYEAKLMFTTTGGRVVLLVSLCYLLNMIDRNVVSIAAPAISAEFGLSKTEMGLAFSIFGVAYLLQTPAGWVCDRFGPRVGLTLFGLIWMVAILICGLAPSLGVLILGRALLGLGEAATSPAITRVIADWTPPTRRGFVIGLTHSFISLGNTAAPPLMAFLMGYLAWRGAFLVLAAVTLVWVVWWYVVYRDDPRDAKGVTAAELAQLSRPRSAKAKAPWGPLTKAMLAATFIYLCVSASFWTFWTWLPSYFFETYHLNLKSSAIFTLSVLFAGVFGDIFGGWTSDAIFRKTGNIRLARSGFVACTMTLAAISVAPVLVLKDVNHAAMALAAGFFFTRASVSPLWAVCTDIAPGWAGSAGGILNTGSAVSAIIAPLAFGFIADATGNLSTPFVASIALLLLGAVLTIWMRPDRQLQGA
ncbi:MFS transporter [Acidisoma cellulosilytica]|uniref:MFS transporter n=1 Tax=Acidisoma cellulosilyticum TaxID=2802395 RepID=A0A963Z1E7_9PROT|nr:MFS transporter [Acidisoma cellulosilyticum]MCB8881092.1 MFS transporter [Acidisoma cellulosilyticum]